MGSRLSTSYRHLTHLRETVGNIPILALTATATPTVIRDMCQQLKLQNPIVVNTGIRRNNLSISIHGKSSSSRKPSSQSILRDLKEILLNPEEANTESVIIYTQSRKECEQLCEILQQASCPAQYYHAGLATAPTAGTIGSMGNWIPEAFVGIKRNFEAVNIKRAAEIQRLVCELINEYRGEEIACTKALVEYRGIPCGNTWEPLLPLTNKQKKELYERIDGFKLDFDSLAVVK